MVETPRRGAIAAALISLVLVTSVRPAAAAISSIGSGAWSDASIWSGGIVPGASEDVTIVPGDTVAVDITASCASLTLAGRLDVVTGTLDAGATADQGVVISSGGGLFIEGGVVNVAGRLVANAGATYEQYNGTLNVTTVGNTSTTQAGFDLASGSRFAMSGGTIALQLGGTGSVGPRDYRNLATTLDITGGTLAVGNAASGAPQTFWLQGAVPDFVIHGAPWAHTARLAGELRVHRRTTLEPGSRLVLYGVFLVQLGDRLTNDGVIDGSTPSSRIVFAGVSPILYEGSGTLGIHSAPLQGIDLDNPAGVTLSPTTPEIVALGIRLFAGTLVNSHKLRLGIGGTSQVRVQCGNTGTPTAGGHFDGPPVFDLGSLGCLLLYERETDVRVTGPEVPPSRSVAYIEVNNSNGVWLSGGNLITTGTLGLVAGPLVTGPSVMVVNAGAGVTRTSGWVAGNLRKDIAAGGSVTRTFEIGDATSYTPLVATFASVTVGDVTAGLAAPDHSGLLLSGIDPTASVNRVWSMSGSVSFSSWSATFNFAAGAIDPGADPSRFIARRYDGAAWHPTSHGPRTATSTRLNGLTAFGEFAIGEQQVTVHEPNGGEVLTVGATAQLAWSMEDSAGVTAVDLAVSRDGGATFDPIASLPGAGGGSYAWTVGPPGTNSDRDTVFSARFRVTTRDAAGPTGSDDSDSGFAIHDISTDVLLARFDLVARDGGVLVSWRLADALGAVARVERSESELGPWRFAEGEKGGIGEVSTLLDRDVVPGHLYYYRLAVTGTDGIVTRFGASAIALPGLAFSVDAPEPNPSSGRFVVSYTLPAAGRVRVSVVDVGGRERAVLADGVEEAGRRRVIWSGGARSRALTPGIYFVRVETAAGAATRKLVLEK